MAAAADVKGAAHDATIKVENNVAALEAALAEARERERTQFFVDAVERAKAKVLRAERDVEGAKQALKNAEAELVTEMDRVAKAKAAEEASAADSAGDTD